MKYMVKGPAEDRFPTRAFSRIYHGSVGPLIHACQWLEALQTVPQRGNNVRGNSNSTTIIIWKEWQPRAAVQFK